MIIFYPTQLTLNIAKFIALNYKLKNLYLPPTISQNEKLQSGFVETNVAIIEENQQELDLGSFKLKLVKKDFISKRSLSSSQISSEPVNLSQLQV